MSLRASLLSVKAVSCPGHSAPTWDCEQLPLPPSALRAASAWPCHAGSKKEQPCVSGPCPRRSSRARAAGRVHLLPEMTISQVLLLKGAPTEPARRRLQGPQAPGAQARHQQAHGRSTHQGRGRRQPYQGPSLDAKAAALQGAFVPLQEGPLGAQAKAEPPRTVSPETDGRMDGWTGGQKGGNGEQGKRL